MTCRYYGLLHRCKDRAYFKPLLYEWIAEEFKIEIIAHSLICFMVETSLFKQDP